MRLHVACILGMATAYVAATQSASARQPAENEEMRAKEAVAACDSGQASKEIEVLGAPWARTLDSTDAWMLHGSTGTTLRSSS